MWRSKTRQPGLLAQKAGNRRYFARSAKIKSFTIACKRRTQGTQCNSIGPKQRSTCELTGRVLYRLQAARLLAAQEPRHVRGYTQHSSQLRPKRLRLQGKSTQKLREEKAKETPFFALVFAKRLRNFAFQTWGAWSINKNSKKRKTRICLIL